MSAMPYFDDFDLSTVDILLISQYVASFPSSAKHGSEMLDEKVAFLKSGQPDLAVQSSIPGNKASQIGDWLVHLSTGSTLVFVAQSMPTISTITLFVLCQRRLLSPSMPLGCARVDETNACFSQFSSRPCRCSSVRTRQNRLQGPRLHDTPHESHLQMAHTRLRPS